MEIVVSEKIPLVSISCITFNHVNYIRQCLDGFLMQMTDFNFEVLIHDDASTDGTEEIIREYEAKYPEIIKPLYEIENQWVKGRKGSAVFNYPRAKGKYIALCEGDDYWIDPYKLQKQVDFLETNADYSICFHRVNELFMNGKCIPEIMNKSSKERTYTIHNLAKGNFIHTPSVIFRSNVITIFPDWFDEAPIGDYPLYMINAKHGKIKYLPELMATYRIQGQGIWSPLTNYEKIKNWLLVLKLLLVEFEENTEVSSLLSKQLLKTYSSLEDEFIHGYVPIYEFEYATSKLIQDIPSFRSLWFKECYLTKSKYITLYIRSIKRITRSTVSKLLRTTKNLVKFEL